MKKFLLIALLISFSPSFAQEWRDPSENETFQKVRERFKAYAEKKNLVYKKSGKSQPATQSGKYKGALEERDVPGFKQFKRWEYFWERRLMPDGSFPSPDHVWNEHKKSNAKRSSSVQSDWSHMGPVTVPTGGGGAGRINCVAIDPTNQNILWVGSPAGGLWKSTDGGTTWSSNTDLLPNLGVSDIAINPLNPSIMYIATGDGDGGDTYSLGVMKSIDGGVTWNTTGLTYVVTNNKYINRLVIDPVNPDVLLAACNNGIWRTQDGGATWLMKRVGNFKDIKFNTANHNILYACAGSNMVKSVNNGLNWALANSGLPTTGVGRIALAVTPADSNVVYALISKPSPDYGFMGIYKSVNGAASWTLQANSPNLLGWSVSGSDNGGQGWYDLGITVSETNPNVVFVGGVNLWKSTDGGVNWSCNAHWYGANGKPYVHADNHMLKFAPNSGTTLYACVDGGLFKSTNGGTSWADKSHGLEIMQFYKIGSSATNPNRVLGGSQDNGTNMIINNAWERVIGGDGMECLVDHSDDMVMFGELYYGDIEKSIDGGQSFYNVTPPGAEGAWVTPYVMDPNDNDIMYIGYDEVWKSYDNGDSWTAITSGLSGGSNYAGLKVANSNSNYVYAMTAGAIYRSTDAGATWTYISDNLPNGSSLFTYITVNPQNENIIYVTTGGYVAADKVFRSTDGGATWTNITMTGLPNVPANCIEVENNSKNGIYVGTDLGVYYLNDDLTAWESFSTNLPNVIVNELEINYMSGKIRAGTYGRGLWESPLYIVTGINETGSKNSQASVYPNPVKDKFFVTVPKEFTGNASIYSADGKLVLSAQLTTLRTEFDAELLNSGTYIIRFEGNISVQPQFISVIK